MKFECDKLSNPTRFDTYKPLKVVNEMVEASTNVGKKRSSPNQKKNGKEIDEPNFGVDGAGDEGGLEH